MAKESSSLSRGSPVTAGGSPAERSNSASQLTADTTVDVARSVQFEDDDARGRGYDEDDEEKEEVDVEYVKSTAELLSDVEELSLQVSRMGNPRPVERNLVAELDASADDDDDEDDRGFVLGERPPLNPEQPGTPTRRVPTRTRTCLTPKKGKPSGGRYDHLYDASDEAELGDSRDDSADLRGGRDETVKNQIHRLSYDEAERDSSQYLELVTHFSLDKVAEFEGKRYRSDASLKWLKMFIYEMKGTRMPQNSWCEPFPLRLGRAAKSWYRQLPKKTQQRWSLLSEAFLGYYCSQFDQSARTRYYSARRTENEPICDFLIRLNGYARTAKIQYEKGGADAADHVEQFLLNCGDDSIVDLLGIA
ncbi:unnamed protein product [Phytophthora fragariaefolia]|uniref:Unnamed protein product n=1 Tax=Phytophthora fragariaefolia TaxID=1490495 RepID=A0A9W6YCS9_9STRA|nr:unnamed protein product [Phytophthora fragariaefolia]